MKDLAGKVAFITGGASGIGLGMAEAFGHEGMSVMLADIETSALEAAVKILRGKNIRVKGVVCDVASRDSVRAAAKETLAQFSKVHVVCNNAGIATGGSIGTIPEQDWDWIIDVNLKGVVYGVEVFAPLIESHGEGGWIVNTASIAGMISPMGAEPYCATKFAVVAMSEGWAQQLASKNIGMSVLCPGFVKTRIDESRRNMPITDGKNSGTEMPGVSAAVQAGIPPQIVGQRVLEAIQGGEFYIFTHPEFKVLVASRFESILSAFDKASTSAALSSLPKRDVPTPP